MQIPIRVIWTSLYLAPVWSAAYLQQPTFEVEDRKCIGGYKTVDCKDSVHLKSCHKCTATLKITSRKHGQTCRTSETIPLMLEALEVKGAAMDASPSYSVSLTNCCLPQLANSHHPQLPQASPGFQPRHPRELTWPSKIKYQYKKAMCLVHWIIYLQLLLFLCHFFFFRKFWLILLCLKR